MLKSMRIHGLGPVKNLAVSFADRLNILTGDNSLGKSFLLDSAFWALTGTWPGGRVALPEANGQRNSPSIAFEVEGKKRSAKQTASFDFHNQSWTREKGRAAMSTLVVYAAVDGGFAVWDPARNYWRKTPTGQIVPAEQPRAYQFTAESLANEAREDGRVLCNGLVNDWASWYYRSLNSPADSPFKLLASVVARLAHPDEPMTVEPPRRVFVDDSREFPTLGMPYGLVPFPHWSAAVRRIVSLAYLLVWAWDEHSQAAELRRENKMERLVLIVDEVEAHLHPKWQRVILPALIQAVDGLRANLSLQVLTVSHSPLVLASLEPLFDEDQDRLFWFDLRNRQVHFQNYPWAKYGDVVGWLTSPIFGLREARSHEAEDVMTQAEEFMAEERSEVPEYLARRAAIERNMRRTVPGDDPIWARWFLKTHGGLPQ